MLVLAGMCFGVAVAMLLLPALPARPQLRAIEAGRPGVMDPVAARGQSLQHRISAWALRTLPERATMSLSSADLDIVGILVTMFDRRTTHAREVMDRVVEVFGERVFDTVITRTVRFPETSVAGEPIITWAPSSQGAKQYRDLALEVLERTS